MCLRLNRSKLYHPAFISFYTLSTLIPPVSTGYVSLYVINRINVNFPCLLDILNTILNDAFIQYSIYQKLHLLYQRKSILRISC